MQKKKVVSLILSGMLAASLLSGCADLSLPVVSFGETAAEESTATETSDESAEAAQEDAGISLETIAALNGVDVSELNTVFDEDGNLSFVGNRLSDEKIADEEEAYDFVTEQLSALLHLDNITLADGDYYTSPHTGITYYRFNQTLPAEIEAKMPDGTFGTLSTDIEYLTNSLKLGVDADGFPVVLASDLSYADLEFDTDNLLSPEDAEAVVAAAHPDVHIYSDATSLTLWEDTTAATISNQAAAAVVYLVYGDNPEFKDGFDCSPYMCYEVRVDGDVDYDSNGIVAELAADTLTTYSYTSIDNTSLVYFDDMEDVGEYTYTLNFDWMSDSDRAAAEAFTGAESIEVTVPVMRCTTDGLYYLGWKEHYISMCNALDFTLARGDWAKLNGYVTDDPEDLDSWHFEKAENEEIGCTYWDDPNYVLASFAKYVQIIDTFGENFGMFESYPSDSYMLLTYYYNDLEIYGTETNTYPTDLSGFIQNAANGGRIYDWTCFITSPNLALCLDDAVMCHEFTHGVNSHFTNSQYANEPGAVMENLADMVGYQMAAVYLNPQLQEEGDWLIGGTFGPVLRNLTDPVSMDDPEYKGGEFYVNPVDPVIINGSAVDHGGVHTNSLIPSYLGVQFVDGTPEDGEQLLTMEESLRMWFEVLYVSNYNTDFIDLGADLKYAAKVLGFTEEQQNYISRLIEKFGFADGNVDPELLAAEDSRTITITLDYEDAAVGEEYYFSDLYYDLMTEAFLMCGGYADNKEQTIRVAQDTSYPEFLIIAQSEQDIQNNTSGYQVFMDPEDIRGDITFHVKKTDVPAGEVLTLGENETIANMTVLEIPDQGEAPLVPYDISIDETTGAVIISMDNPDQSVVVTKADGMAEGEYNMYLVDFGMSADEEAAPNESTEEQEVDAEAEEAQKAEKEAVEESGEEDGEDQASSGRSITKIMRSWRSFQTIGDVDTSKKSYQQPVTIINNSGQRIVRMCIAASEDTCWGDDIMGQYYMDDGDELETSFCVHDNYTDYDIYWVYEDGTTDTCSGFDFSEYPTNGFRVTIKPDSVSTGYDVSSR